MGLFSSIKSFLGLDKKQEVIQEVNTELFLEAVKKATIVETIKEVAVSENTVQFPVTTPDPVVVDTKDVQETLNVKVEEPTKEKKVIVKKQPAPVSKEKPAPKKQGTEKPKGKKTK